MFKNIISTTTIRILNAVISFIIVLICTNELGSTVYGEIGLMILSISIILLANDLIAGSSIVYFASRYPTLQLLFPAYLWAIIVVALAGFIFYILSFFPSIYHTIVPNQLGKHVLLLSLLNSFNAIHQNLLIGNEKIKTYNLVFLSQFLLQISTLVLCIYVFEEKNIYSYVYALYISYFVAWVIGIFTTKSLFVKISMKGMWKRVQRIVHYGFLIQLANFIQLGNRRFSFYVVKPYLGLSRLGIYNAAIQLAEGLKIISQSIAVVQYSRISNCHDERYAAELTVRLMKFTVFVTFVALCLLLVIPSEIFVRMFGTDFLDVKKVLFGLSPGILFLAMNAIYSPFFSGTGRPQHNTMGSGIGFMIFLALCFVLIPNLGIVGAAVTTSLSYFGIAVYQSIIFIKITKMPLKAFLINKTDFLFFKNLLGEIVKKK